MPFGPIVSWSSEDRIRETLQRAKKHLGPAFGAQIDALLSPENLAVMTGTLLIWGGSHLFGVGEIVDVGLLLFGAFMLGPAIVDVAENLVRFAACVNARTDSDIDRAAKAFADAVVKGGFTVVMALLLRKGAKGMEAARAPGVVRPSWLEVAKPRAPGLPRVGADPQPGSFWSRLPAVGDASLAAGEGSTTAFGEIVYSTRGSASEQALVLLHESIHRLLSPRLGLLRSFRARLGTAGYARSFLMKYLEEALAESYAQLRVNGLKGLLTGICFPVANGYMTITQLGSELAAMGTVAGSVLLGTLVVENTHFAITQWEALPDWAAARPAPRPGVIQARPIDITGGTRLQVQHGDTLSGIAKSQYGDFKLWPLIYDLNRDLVGPDPNRLQVGQRLLLLPLETYSAAELAAARQRAPSWKKTAGAAAH